MSSAAITSPSVGGKRRVVVASSSALLSSSSPKTRTTRDGSNNNNNRVNNNNNNMNGQEEESSSLAASLLLLLPAVAAAKGNSRSYYIRRRRRLHAASLVVVGIILLISLAYVWSGTRRMYKTYLNNETTTATTLEKVQQQQQQHPATTARAAEVARRRQTLSCNCNNTTNEWPTFPQRQQQPTAETTTSSSLQQTTEQQQQQQPKSQVFTGEKFRTFPGQLRLQQQAREERRRSSFFPRMVSYNCRQWMVVHAAAASSRRPTTAIVRAAQVKHWCLVIVEDAAAAAAQTTPYETLGDSMKHVFFLSVQLQTKFLEGGSTTATSVPLVGLLPSEGAARSLMLGHLFAIRHGAQVIFEFTDNQVLLQSSYEGVASPFSPLLRQQQRIPVTDWIQPNADKLERQAAATAASNSRRTFSDEVEEEEDTAAATTTTIPLSPKDDDQQQQQQKPSSSSHHLLVRLVEPNHYLTFHARNAERPAQAPPMELERRRLLLNPYPFMFPTAVHQNLQHQVWPRGFPLEVLQLPWTWSNMNYNQRRQNVTMASLPLHKLAVLPSVGSGDVDAIYRLTRDTDLKFERSAPMLLLNRGMYTPYNTHATLHTQAAFWGLFLPVSLPSSVADIWRSYIAQRFFHELQMAVVLAPPVVTRDMQQEAARPLLERQMEQEKILLRELSDQDPLFRQTGALLEFLSAWTSSAQTLPARLERLYIDLYERGYVELVDVQALQEWLLTLIVDLNYRVPDLPRAVDPDGERSALQPPAPHYGNGPLELVKQPTLHRQGFVAYPHFQVNAKGQSYRDYVKGANASSSMHDFEDFRDSVQQRPTNRTILKLLCMTKDEWPLTKTWVLYHGELLGSFEHLYILDASTREGCPECIDFLHYARHQLGVNVIFSKANLNELQAELNRVTRHITGSSDFVLKMDPDEYLTFVQNNASTTCRHRRRTEPPADTDAADEARVEQTQSSAEGESVTTTKVTSDAAEDDETKAAGASDQDDASAATERRRRLVLSGLNHRRLKKTSKRKTSGNKTAAAPAPVPNVAETKDAVDAVDANGSTKVATTAADEGDEQAESATSVEISATTEGGKDAQASLGNPTNLVEDCSLSPYGFAEYLDSGQLHTDYKRFASGNRVVVGMVQPSMERESVCNAGLGDDICALHFYRPGVKLRFKTIHNSLSVNEVDLGGHRGNFLPPFQKSPDEDDIMAHSVGVIHVHRRCLYHEVNNTRKAMIGHDFLDKEDSDQVALEKLMAITKTNTTQQVCEFDNSRFHLRSSHKLAFYMKYLANCPLTQPRAFYTSEQQMARINPDLKDFVTKTLEKYGAAVAPKEPSSLPPEELPESLSLAK